MLARHLAGGGDREAALRRYEHQRIAGTAPLAKRARRQGKLMQGDNLLLAALRTASFRFAPTGQVLKGFEKILTFEG